MQTDFTQQAMLYQQGDPPGQSSRMESTNSSEHRAAGLHTQHIDFGILQVTWAGVQAYSCRTAARFSWQAKRCARSLSVVLPRP
jgi:hypothetical protein